MDFQKIVRAGDIVLTSSRSPLACLIRGKTAGLRQMFNLRVANHAGIVYRDGGLFKIAEMLTKIHSTPFEDYTRKDFWKDEIIYVKRSKFFDNDAHQYAVNAKIVFDLSQAIKYDYKGILEYLWPKIEDRPDKYYCSEYCRHVTQHCGSDVEHPRYKKEDDIPPIGIQTAFNYTTVWSAFA